MYSFRGGRLKICVMRAQNYTNRSRPPHHQICAAEYLIGSSCVRMTSKGEHGKLEKELYTCIALGGGGLCSSRMEFKAGAFLCVVVDSTRRTSRELWSMCVFISKHLRGVISLALNCVCVLAEQP
jgi:hypothetical protein